MGFSSGKDRRGLVSEINVTPMVDVMLVLLIIFMVTAPMMTQGLEVDLPQTTARSLVQEDEPIVITLDKEGKITIGKLEVIKALLHQELEKEFIKNKEQSIFLKADKQVPYGLVVSIMAEIKAAGFDKLGMITQQKEETR
ncbi:MAG: protein TolR [Proteobacteria bacterium]|nr:protein TolR [Pseudomonadota bacterium]MBU1233722.1 protein TolR [Pseudomonadota bacterium]MBU1420487.1 protein TolR [Pseudomonadota bacterium]MBU1456050.1 protein TolR [Pseudomonadota bacterium]